MLTQQKDDLLPTLTVFDVALDTPRNLLLISIPQAQLGRAQSESSGVSEALGVPVEFQAGTADHDAACTSRTNCTSPMRGGIQVEKGSTNGSACTMSFHVIRSGSDEQFLTASHCGYAGSDTWYHDGWGLVGGEQGSIYLSGIDAMRVQMSDAQASDRVYTNKASNYVTLDWAGYPVVGQVACVSGAGGGWRCGTITSEFTSWTSSTCGCTVYGADASYTTVSGDIGGPVVLGNFVTGATEGLGINNTSGGMMAILPDALSALGVTLKT